MAVRIRNRLETDLRIELDFGGKPLGKILEARERHLDHDVGILGGAGKAVNICGESARPKMRHPSVIESAQGGGNSLARCHGRGTG